MFRFDLARIITEIFIFEILEMGQFRSKLLAFRSFSERAKYITESDSTISYGLSLMIPPRSDLDRAANALMGWLSLSTAPLSERALNEVFKNVLRHWKLSLGKGTGSSSNQSDILFSDSENLSVSSVLRRCEPYVVVDHGNDLVQFSRTTVEQAAVYVDSELKKGKLAMFLAKTCLDYFDAVEDFAEEGCMTELQLTTMLQKHAFLDHATQFAFYVALAHNIDDEEQDDLDEKVFHFLDSPSRVLAMQVFLYTNKTAPDQDEIFSSWEHFKSWVNSTSRLHAASRWGLLKTVKTLLKKDEEDILGKDFHGSIALHEAAKSGSTGVVKELLNVVTTDDQIMASAVNDKGKTPLFYALRGNHGGAVVLLFEAQCAGLTIKDVDNIKGTELDNAVPQYCLSKSELLDGADGAAYMDTALIKAVQDRLEVVATLLMHRGANPNAKDPKGKSVLYAAVQNGQDHLAALFLLKGANPSCGVPEDLEPILHLAVQNRLRLTVDCILESRSVDVNCQNLEGRTALFVAINTKDEEWAMDMTRLLLWNRLNVDLADKHDNHLMHIVAREGYVDVFAEIMSQSSLIAEPKNDKGKTPFKIAIEYGHYQIASFFRPIHDGQRQLG
jgi:ankyrin repeat protein